MLSSGSIWPFDAKRLAALTINAGLGGTNGTCPMQMPVLYRLPAAQ